MTDQDAQGQDGNVEPTEEQKRLAERRLQDEVARHRKAEEDERHNLRNGCVGCLVLLVLLLLIGFIFF